MHLALGAAQLADIDVDIADRCLGEASTLAAVSAILAIAKSHADKATV